MIHIHKKHWVVVKTTANVPDSDCKLAYMTHFETAANGEPLKSFESRKETGISWAMGYHKKETDNVDFLFNNQPTKGFKVVGSQSRWSTQNKVIRIEDPRGFVVEIPTENLTTLLKHTVVDHGLIMDECVWGKEGNNHLLLPINSEVYQTALKQTGEYKNKVKFNQLKVGNVVKFSVDSEEEYVFLGKGKATWRMTTKQGQITKSSFGFFMSRPYIRQEDDPVINVEEITDNKYAFIFKKISVGGYTSDWLYKSSGSCIVVRVIEEIPSVERFVAGMPDRIRPDSYGSTIYTEAETIGVTFKE